MQEKGLANGLTMSFVRKVKSKSDKAKTENLVEKNRKNLLKSIKAYTNLCDKWSISGQNCPLVILHKQRK